MLEFVALPSHNTCVYYVGNKFSAHLYILFGLAIAKAQKIITYSKAIMRASFFFWFSETKNL